MNTNSIMLVGNLVGDVKLEEIKYKKGKKTETFEKATFQLAVNRKKDSNQDADFINVEFTGKLAGIAHTYLSQGKKVLVQGRLNINQYGEKGSRKWFTVIAGENIEFLSSKEIETKTKKAA
jgi:single-strand DNA-binding protein